MASSTHFMKLFAIKVFFFMKPRLLNIFRSAIAIEMVKRISNTTEQEKYLPKDIKVQS